MNLKANLKTSIRAKLRAKFRTQVDAHAGANTPTSRAGTEAQKVPSQEQANQKLNERLIQIFQGGRSELWAAYQPHGYEPNLQHALQKIANAHEITWVFPRVKDTDRECEMEFYCPQNEESFFRNDWGLNEPDPEKSQKVEPAEIKGYLIPGLAFDSHGARLGRGRGYFDRYLSRLDHQMKTKIGIAFDEQILEESLPFESHDIAMDIVLSERRCFVSRSWLENPRVETQYIRSGLRTAIPYEEFNTSSALTSPERTKP